MKTRKCNCRFLRPAARLLNGLKRQALDERGAVMLEFVLVAPVMCYLIASTLFFQSQLDYAQDQIMKTRQKTWEKALPGVAETTTGENSDADKFFVGLPFRVAIGASAIAGLNVGVGPALAGARYLGGDNFPGTPYDTLKLKRDNYLNDYIAPDAVPVTGWAKMMGGFGQWFGTKIGTGDPIVPDGLKNSKWKDRYSFTVNPWMRQYSDELDPSQYSIPFLSFANMQLAWDILDMIPNANRGPLDRIDVRDDIDIGENTPPAIGFALFSQFNESDPCDQLKLTEENSISSIVK